MQSHYSDLSLVCVFNVLDYFKSWQLIQIELLQQHTYKYIIMR